jgi:hypothetical protein
MEFLGQFITNHPWITALLLLAGLVILGILIKSASSINIGQFHWQSKMDLRVKELEKELESLKTQLVKGELESRIRDEFKTLRNVASNKRRLFSISFVEVERTIFAKAYQDLIPVEMDTVRDKTIDNHRLLILHGLIMNLSPELIRLIFENDFLPLPTKKTPPNEVPKLEKDFKEDLFNRCFYVLTLCKEVIRRNWDAPFGKETYEHSYFPDIEQKVMEEITNYFHDVILARDISIEACFTEYGHMFNSYDSFKKYFVKRLQELY